ncbi:MAG: CDP-glucose 4,6-dehydratase [Planktomarina sp.]|nr:CDP-glucose 4,6-dehydratase [Planktomarina sp.]
MEGLGVTFWSGKRVLLTGHTGFKGAWASRWLASLGAKVVGVSRPPEMGPTLYDILGQDHMMASHFVDLRDAEAVVDVVRSARPEIVFHFAAQALVRKSYNSPVSTFGSNVMGTVHVLDALRCHAKPKAIVVVTSDKVYENDETGCAFTETSRLGGYDPYSASKAATEIVVSSYRRSYFEEQGIPLVTARGGNVIGGGDFSEDRIVPDVVRAVSLGKIPEIRNPEATRPWQHVLDCLDGYFTYVEALVSADKVLPRALNFGPQLNSSAVTVGALTNALMRSMDSQAIFSKSVEGGAHEMATLSIDPSLASRSLNWEPRLTGDAILQLTAEWYGSFIAGKNMKKITDNQINNYRDAAQ